MRNRSVLLVAILTLFAVSLSASVIGTNTPALPLTAARVAALPKAERTQWQDYLDRSSKQKKADRAFMNVEVEKAGLTAPLIPPADHNAQSLPLDAPAGWYASAEARRIAGIVISFQTPAGGWSKNINMATRARRLGESLALVSEAPEVEEERWCMHWAYVGTFDNEATYTQMLFLAKVITALKPGDAEPYRASFLRGMDYLFAAQFPNGGWPQIWPLEGGYHDAITFNDDALTHVLELLEDVAEAGPGFAFVPGEVRARAKASVARGIDCILATQIIENGKHTVWGQQHDVLTLKPDGARNYEMPAQVSSESAGVVLFLMSLPDPSPAVVEAVHAAAAWLKKTEIYDYAWKRGDNGTRLTPAKGEGPIWSRYNEIGTDRPIFGDRDKTIHDCVDDLSPERQNGYDWYNIKPQEALDRYAQWSRLHPAK